MTKRPSRMISVAFLAVLALGAAVGFFLLHGYIETQGKEDSIHPTDYLPEVTFLTGESTLQVEVVQSSMDRIRGLSGRKTLKQGTGMFFVFPKPGKHGIWMKEMHFPIDIIWLDEELRVITIVERVHPDTFPESFYPDEPALYVLEVEAGYAAAQGIVPGDQLEVVGSDL